LFRPAAPALQLTSLSFAVGLSSNVDHRYHRLLQDLSFRLFSLILRPEARARPVAAQGSSITSNLLPCLALYTKAIATIIWDPAETAKARTIHKDN